jgi:O-antigen/teichoic acid export membrane protein
MSSRNIVDKSISSMLWSYLSLFSTKALNLIAIVIIAMYLSPEEFGLMAFGIVIIGYFELTQTFGMAAYLISTRDDVEEAAHAVFAFSVTISVALFALMWTSAEVVAGFFTQPELADVLRFLSISLLIEAFAQVHNSLLQRELKFRLKVLPDIGRGLAKGFLSIGLAMTGFGVWSLVYGHIAGTLAWTVIVIAVRPWWPRRLPRLAVLRSAIGYGSNILGGALCNAVPRSLDQLLIGKFLGPGALGLYALANRMPHLALKTFSMEANKVLHPLMSTMQQDEDSLRAYYYGVVRYFSLIILPMGVALSLATKPLIHTVYNEQWYGMIPVMQVLSIAIAMSVINGLPGTLYKAVNRSDYFFLSALISLPIYVVVFFVAVQFGIVEMAVAQVLLVFMVYVPNFVILRRLIGVTVGRTLGATTAGAACAATAAIGGFAAQALVTEPGPLQLVATALSCLAAYVLALWRIAPEVLSEFRRVLGKGLRRKKRGRDE